MNVLMSAFGGKADIDPDTARPIIGLHDGQRAMGYNARNDEIRDNIVLPRCEIALNKKFLISIAEISAR
jgi:hypothetical protein